MSARRELAERLLAEGALDDLAPPVPETIGRYRVQELLGQGATSDVFLAEDPLIGRPVAIKLLLLTLDPEREEMLRREMRVLGELRHENVVQVFDAGIHEDRPYYVMERVGRTSLAEAELPLRERVEVLVAVARACQAAHEKGIVHRDLKPANVLLGDRPVVADFGLAALLAEQGGPPAGTPYSMAPEQLAAGAVDARTDVWALGVMLYEALAGRPPFVADSLPGLVTAIRTAQPPRPSTLARDVPPALERTALRALAKDPAGRHASAAAFQRELEAWLRPRSRVPFLALPLLLLAPVAALALAPRQTKESAPTPSSAPPPLAIAPRLPLRAAFARDLEGWQGAGAAWVAGEGRAAPGALRLASGSAAWELLAPGGTIRVGAWCRSSGARAYLSLEALDGAGARLAASSVPRGGPEWVFLETTLTLLPEGSRVVARVALEGPGEALIDDVWIGPAAWVPIPYRAGFEPGEHGGDPLGGLIVPAECALAGWTARPAEDGGTRCLLLELDPAGAATAFGNVATSARVPAGGQVALRGRVRVEGCQAGLWIRVDRADGSFAFLENMSARPIASAEWATYEVLAPIAPDAAAVSFGVLTYEAAPGTPARVWIDELSLESSSE